MFENSLFYLSFYWQMYINVCDVPCVLFYEETQQWVSYEIKGSASFYIL